jgi:hypothetical protein
MTWRGLIPRAQKAHPLSDRGAAAFAVNFYRLIDTSAGRERVNVADALRETRKLFYANGDPTFLGYVYYGDPHPYLTKALARTTGPSEYASDHAAGKAADGNPNTFWVSQVVRTAGYAYLIFGWDTERTVSEVEVVFHSDLYQGMVTLYWSDGRQWQWLVDRPVKTRRVAVVLSGWPPGGYCAVREVIIK